jgi:hypothetical protein
MSTIESSISKKSSKSVAKRTATSRFTPKPSPTLSKRVIRLARGTQDLPHHTNISRLSYRSAKPGKLRWFSFWIVVVWLVLGSGLVSAKWLVHRLPPTNCQALVPMTADSERLYCLQQAAESGNLDDLVAAMNFVSDWHQDRPLYGEGQRLLQQWSQSILTLAKAELDAGNLADAIELARLIPVRSPLYPEAQVQVATWQRDWQSAGTIVSQFETAMAEQKWHQAFQLADRLTQSPLKYWREERASALAWMLSREQEAAQTLETAEQLAASQNPNAISQALHLLQNIPEDTHAKERAKQKQALWSRSLLEITAKRLEQQDYAGAIATAKAVPHDDAHYPEAQDWIALSRASETAQKEDIAALLDALEVVQQIQPQSPLFPQAKMRAELWQSQIQG